MLLLKPNEIIIGDSRLTNHLVTDISDVEGFKVHLQTS